MPNIRTYELPVQQAELRPNNLGAEAWAQAGQHEAQAAWRVSEFGRETGQAIGSGVASLGRPAEQLVQNQQDFANLNKLGSLYSGAMSDMTEDAGKFAQSHPGDHDAMEQYRQDAFQKIDDLGQNAHSAKEKEFATREGLRIKDEIARRLVDYGSAAAGEQVTTNLQHTVGNAADLLDGTTHGLDVAISMTRDMFKSQLDASGLSGPRYDAAQKQMEAAENALVLADAQKLALKNPGALKQMLDDGTYMSRVVGGQPLRSYLTPEHQVELQKRAEEGLKAAQTTATADNKQWSNDQMMKNYTENMSADGVPNVKFFQQLHAIGGVTDAFGHYRADPAEIDRARAAANAAMNEPSHMPSDPSVLSEIRRGVWTPAGQPGHIGADELNQIMVQNTPQHTLLSAKDHALYMGFIKDAAANPEKAADMAEFERYFANGVQPFVLKSTGASIDGVKNYSAESSARAEQLRMTALPQFQRGLAQHVPIAEMLDPDSPKSVFPRKLIEQSQPTQDEQNAIHAIGSTATPLKSLNQKALEGAQDRWKKYQLEKEFNLQQIGHVTRPVWAPPINQPNLQPRVAPGSLSP